MSRTSIAAVVPNYNYAAFLPARLASLSAQSRAVDALIFLDDASSDTSMAVAESLLASWTAPVKVYRNQRNSGSVLLQWRRGVDLVDTDFVWIAEADDAAAPDFLSVLAERLDNDPDAILAFSDSAAINAGGTIISADSKDYTSAFDSGLRQDGVFEAAEFLRRFLCPRNSMVSASAVLWRTSALRAAFDRLGQEAADWLCAGDWRLYVEACADAGWVHYTAEPLSFHRRHAASVTGRTPRTRHFAEVVGMLSLLRRVVGPNPGKEAQMRDHLAMLRRAWHLGDMK